MASPISKHDRSTWCPFLLFFVLALAATGLCDEPSSPLFLSQTAATTLIDSLSLFGNERVLEIGCKRGDITAQLAKKLPRGSILAIDIFPSLLATAKRRFSTHTHPPVRCLLMSAEDLRFKETFDLAISFHVLHSIPNHRLVIRKIFQSLKPNGRFVVTMATGLPKPLMTALTRLSASKAWRGHLSHFSPQWNFTSSETYLAWLKEEGFTLEKVTLVDNTHRFTSTATFSDFISLWLPHLFALPSFLQAPFLSALIENYTALCPVDKNGQVLCPLSHFEVIAKKSPPKQ